MAKPYQDGSGWAFRLRVQGQDIFRSGFKSEKEAQQEANDLAADLRKSDKPALLGPQRTSVGQALSDYAREVLPHHKGAPQEARRVNRYLRALGLPVIVLEEFQGVAPVKERLRKRKKEQTVHWTVTLIPETERTVPNGLHKHRAAIEAESQATSAMRRRLARTMMADVTKHMLQRFTLIASVERQKAQSELKKAIAIKHATLEYEALATLHGDAGRATALLLARASAVSASAWTLPGRAAACAEIQPAHEVFMLALEKARIFLSDETMSKGSQLSSTLSQLMVQLILNSDGPIESVLPYQSVMTTCTQIQSALKARVDMLTSIEAQIAQSDDVRSA